MRTARDILSRGLLYSNKNQYNEAIEDFNMTLKLDPDNDVANSNRKFCMQAIEDKKKANWIKSPKKRLMLNDLHKKSCRLNSWPQIRYQYHLPTAAASHDHIRLPV